MKSNSVTSNSEKETIAFARQWAKSLRSGDIVALQGDLGAGKTHFVKGIAEAFGLNKSAVHSPTFALIHEYGGEPPLFHFDCYRMESVHEALEIGIEEYLYANGVCIIEWPERIASILPEDCIWVSLKNIAKNQREITIQEK